MMAFRKPGHACVSDPRSGSAVRGEIKAAVSVVAELHGRVVWYNDIEEGFTIGRFDTRGTINEYTCNQTTFEESC